jgi:ferredoxin
MADKSAKVPDSVPGKYFVDDTCIDCDACRATAPDNFARNEDGGYSYVIKQPENEEEINLCIDALEGCPVESIGDDGDEE